MVLPIGQEKRCMYILLWSGIEPTTRNNFTKSILHQIVLQCIRFQQPSGQSADTMPHGPDFWLNSKLQTTLHIPVKKASYRIVTGTIFWKLIHEYHADLEGGWKSKTPLLQLENSNSNIYIIKPSPSSQKKLLDPRISITIKVHLTTILY